MNIHILPTQTKWIIYQYTNKPLVGVMIYWDQNQKTYITNDEELKKEIGVSI
jgi:hypothetical protein